MTLEQVSSVLDLTAEWVAGVQIQDPERATHVVRFFAKICNRREERLISEACGQLLIGIASNHEFAMSALTSDSCVRRLRSYVQQHAQALEAFPHDQRDTVLAICTLDPVRIDDEIVSFVGHAAERTAARPQATSTHASAWGGDNEWSMLAPALAPERALGLARHFLETAQNFYEPMRGRSGALAALGDVSAALPTGDCKRMFADVAALFDDPVDDRSITGLIAAASNPFSSFRIRDTASDLRGGALYALVKLAETAEDYVAVQELGVRLLVTDDEWVAEQTAQALILVPSDQRTLDVETLRLLSASAARSLLAVMWAENPADAPLGNDLACDPSPAVRRSLARALAGNNSSVAETLKVDIRRSVRRRVSTPRSDLP